jgi:hypothetical protein
MAIIVSAPIVIDNYNAAELKHTLDDTICRVLAEDFHYKVNHTHTDRKLLLGYTACLIAGAATAYSYFVPFPECKPVLAACVIACVVFLSIGVSLRLMILTKAKSFKQILCAEWCHAVVCYLR